MRKKFLFTFFFFLVKITFVFSQDIHLSAFHFIKSNFNAAWQSPTFVGYSASAGFRNQYRSVPVNYNTGIISFNKQTQIKNNNLGIGILLNTDKAGDISYSKTELAIPISFHFKVIKNNFLSFALAPGFKTLSVDQSKMTFDQQYQQGQFNASNSNGENFSAFNVFIPTMLSSINFTFLEFKKFRTIQFGISRKLQFIKNKEWVKNSVPSFNSLNNFNFSFDYIVNENNFIGFSSMFQNQSKQNNLIGGLTYTNVLNRNQGIEKQISLGVYFRKNDAIIFQPGFSFDNYDFVFSYDVSVGKVKSVTNSKGAMELCVRWKLSTFFQSLPIKKTCPVFL